MDWGGYFPLDRLIVGDCINGVGDSFFEFIDVNNSGERFLCLWVGFHTFWDSLVLLVNHELRWVTLTILVAIKVEGWAIVPRYIISSVE